MAEISLTFKEGGGYDAPWVGIKAASVDEAIQVLGEFRAKQGFQAVKKSAAEFRASVPASHGQAVATVTQVIPGSQEQPQALPDAATPHCSKCSHAGQWKEGVSKLGTPYSGWFCLNNMCDNFWKPVK